MLSHLKYFKKIILAARWKKHGEKRMVMVRIIATAIITMKKQPCPGSGRDEK